MIVIVLIGSDFEEKRRKNPRSDQIQAQIEVYFITVIFWKLYQSSIDF